MTGPTTRDEMWMATLCHLSQNESFVLGDVAGVNESNRETARRVWRVWEDLGLLEREHEGAQVWAKTDLADVLLNTRKGLEFNAENAGDSEC